MALAREQAARAAAEEATRALDLPGRGQQGPGQLARPARRRCAAWPALRGALPGRPRRRHADRRARPSRGRPSWPGSTRPTTGSTPLPLTGREAPHDELRAAVRARAGRGGRPRSWSAAWPLPSRRDGRRRRRAGRPRRLRSAVVLPLPARGRTLGALALALGDSGRRFAPGDLALADDLAGRAAIALDNARLYRDVQEADRRKNEFLAMLAHELRNPLAPIRNAVHILRAAAARDDPQLQQVRDMIDRQVQQLVRLVDDLLDVSRITARQDPPADRAASTLAAVVGARRGDQPAADRRPASTS